MAWQQFDESLIQPQPNLLVNPQIVLTFTNYSKSSDLATVLADEIPQTNGYDRPDLTVSFNGIEPDGFGNVRYENLNITASGGSIVAQRYALIADGKAIAFVDLSINLSDGENFALRNLAFGVGPQGTRFNGAPGENAFAITIADYTQPAIGSNVLISLNQGSGFLAPGMNCFYSSPGKMGWYEVISIGGTSATCQNLGLGGSNPGEIMVSGGQLVVVGIQGPAGPPGSEASGASASVHYVAALDNTNPPASGQGKIVTSPPGSTLLEDIIQLKLPPSGYHTIGDTDGLGIGPTRPDTAWFERLAEQSILQLAGTSADQGKQAWYIVNSVTIGSENIVNVTFDSQRGVGNSLSVGTGFSLSVKEPPTTGASTAYELSMPLSMKFENSATDPANDIMIVSDGTSIVLSDGKPNTRAYYPVLAGMYVKQLDVAFAEGTEGSTTGGLIPTPPPTDQDYYLLAIGKSGEPGTPVQFAFTDAYLPDGVGLTLPATYDRFRYLWPVKSEAGAIRLFIQQGRWHYWHKISVDTTDPLLGETIITIDGFPDFEFAGLINFFSGIPNTGFLSAYCWVESKNNTVTFPTVINANKTSAYRSATDQFWGSNDIIVQVIDSQVRAFSTAALAGDWSAPPGFSLSAIDLETFWSK